MTASTEELNLNKNDVEYQKNHHNRLFAFPASTTCTNFNLTVSHNVQVEPAKKVAKKSHQKVAKKVAKKVVKMIKKSQFSHGTYEPKYHSSPLVILIELSLMTMWFLFVNFRTVRDQRSETVR